MEKENTHASAPPFPSMLPNLSAASVNNSFVIKIIIVKEGSSEEDYDSVNLYELISKNDFKKLKKEYEYRIKSYKILTLTPVSLQNADHTEKCIGYITINGNYDTLGLIDSIKDIINNKVEKTLNIKLIVDVDEEIRGEEKTRENIHTPYEALRVSRQVATKNSWTVYINSHSNFFFNIYSFNKDTPPVGSVFNHIIHLLYYGQIEKCNIFFGDSTSGEYDDIFFNIILKYLYKIKNFTMTDSRQLNQLIIDEKVTLIDTLSKAIEHVLITITDYDVNIIGFKQKIADEEKILVIFSKIQPANPKDNESLQSTILRSQMKLFTLQTTLSAYVDTINLLNLKHELYTIYLHNIENDIPFLNILTLGLNGTWFGPLLTRLYKNSNMLILKDFQFDEMFNSFNIMNVKSENPVLNELNELDLRVEEDKHRFFEIVEHLSISIENKAKMHDLLDGNIITMAQLGYIGQLLGFSETNIITSGCNNYKSGSANINAELSEYIHDDPNGLAFGKYKRERIRTEKQKGKKRKQTKKREQPKKIRKKRTGKQSGKRSVKYKGKYKGNYKGKQSGKRSGKKR